MERIELAVKNGVSPKVVKRRLGIGKNQMHTLRDKETNITTNMEIAYLRNSSELRAEVATSRMIMEEGVDQRK